MLNHLQPRPLRIGLLDFGDGRGEQEVDEFRFQRGEDVLGEELADVAVTAGQMGDEVVRVVEPAQ